MIVAKIAKNRWMVWNCNAIDHIEVPDPLMLHLPRFVRVRQLHLTSNSAGKHFVKCTCEGRTREGVPCSCFFRISDNAGVNSEDIVDLGMVDARYLRMYNSCYGEDSPNGALMYTAQRECFENERMGTLVSENTMHKLVHDDDAEYPIMGISMTEKDFDEAKYVMSLNACTTLDLEQWRMFECGYDEEEGTDEEQKCAALSEEAIMSHGAERLKKGLELSMQDPNDGEGELCSGEEKIEQYNKWTRKLIELQKDPRVDIRNRGIPTSTNLQKMGIPCK